MSFSLFTDFLAFLILSLSSGLPGYNSVWLAHHANSGRPAIAYQTFSHWVFIQFWEEGRKECDYPL